MKLRQHATQITTLARQLVGCNRVRVDLGYRGGVNHKGADIVTPNILEIADYEKSDLHDFDRGRKFWAAVNIPEPEALFDFYVYVPFYGDWTLEDNLLVRFIDGHISHAYMTHHEREPFFTAEAYK